MNSILQSLFSFILGLALSLLGLIHSVNKYPGLRAFATFLAALPSLASVLYFALGVLAALAGVLLLVRSLRRLRVRWRYLQQLTRGPRQRPEEEEQDYAGVYR